MISGIFLYINRKELIFIANFSGNDYLNYRLGLDKGFYKTILCTDDKRFGGRGIINKKSYKTAKKYAHGKGDSILIKLPRFSAMYLVKSLEK